MPIRVAINGFGRIGRMAFRAIAKEAEFADIEVVAINDLLEPDYLAYMLKYDSVHGNFDGDVAVDGNDLLVNGRRIRLSAERHPEQLNWGEVKADVVIEATGHFLNHEGCARHLQAGARRVVQSAPAKDNTPMFVYGVNHHTYAGEDIVSAASCTTNGLAPVAKVLNDNFGIKRGLMSTVHAATATQKTVDGPSGKDWRGGRGTGMAFRVPTSDVSVVDLTVELECPASYEEICAAMKAASESGPLKGVLGYTGDSVVSTDFRGCRLPSIFDAGAGIALDPTFVKVVAWYDNEYGYTCNLLRLVRHISH
ncbi:MAG: type I glyceraldehyde-3-phosphate dehydrogenase [Betaproteobacteria bacterium HGW-Betaproteobacteria-6]|nr:MAG: type I glyceraldehyde-3-phosphate dehydrogenase [Betaproteobacteria bacterium HGW-Betaproteobacteria-6]